MFRFAALLASVALRIGLGAGLATDAPLPDVDVVLTNATDKVHDFYEHAADMRNQVSKQQESSRDMLSRKKREYEAALEAQAKMNKNISATNELLHQHNARQREDNARMESSLTALFASNKQLHHALQLLGERVAMAQRFVAESLHVTDDADAMELEVLATTSPKPSLELLLDSEGDDEEPALLQFLSSPTPTGVPQQYVDSLANSLSDIHSAELEASDELKKQFEARFEIGMKRRELLNATQASLLEKRAELHARWKVLLQTQEKLEATHRQLHNRLNALQVFAEKLGSLSGRALDVIAGTPAKPAAEAPAAKNATGTETAKPNATAPSAAAARENATAKAPAMNGSATNASVKLPTSPLGATENATAKAPAMNSSATTASVKLPQAKVGVPNSTSTNAPGFPRKVAMAHRVNDTFTNASGKVRLPAATAVAPLAKSGLANASVNGSQPVKAFGKAKVPGKPVTVSANVSSSAASTLASNATSARAEASNLSTKLAGAAAAAKVAVVRALRHQPQTSSFKGWLSNLR